MSFSFLVCCTWTNVAAVFCQHAFRCPIFQPDLLTRRGFWRSHRHICLTTILFKKKWALVHVFVWFVFPPQHLCHSWFLYCSCYVYLFCSMTTLCGYMSWHVRLFCWQPCYSLVVRVDVQSCQCSCNGYKFNERRTIFEAALCVPNCRCLDPRTIVAVGDHVVGLIVFFRVLMVANCCDLGNSRDGSGIFGIHGIFIFEQRCCDAYEPEKRKIAFCGQAPTVTSCRYGFWSRSECFLTASPVANVYDVSFDSKLH